MNRRVRINMHPRAFGDNKPPRWFQAMLEDVITAYANEWKVDSKSVREWAILDGNNRDLRIKEIFGSFGVPVETYQHPELPSWGVLMPEDCEMVVEYKLRHSGADAR